MPAEWEPHDATWIAWPHNEDDWPGKFGPIPWVVGDIVKQLSRVERVGILVNHETIVAAQTILAKVGANLQNVTFLKTATDRIWTRDFGPTFVKRPNGECTALHWLFNGWAKYENWRHDVAAGHAIAKLTGFPVVEPTCHGRRVVFEGGSIDVNGEGLLLTTEQCLLSEKQQRNPGMSHADYESVFASCLGIRRVIWLNDGIVGDDTHGHVDDLARFVSPNTIVTVVEDDSRDANYEPLQENLERLHRATDLAGDPLKIVPLPMPKPVYFDGQRLPASYANFYVANRLVLVPTFNDPNDRIALARLALVFPDRQVVGIYCGDLVWGLGTLHCMTQQQPH